MSRDWSQLRYVDMTYNERRRAVTMDALAWVVGLVTVILVLWVVGTAIDGRYPS